MLVRPDIRGRDAFTVPGSAANHKIVVIDDIAQFGQETHIFAMLCMASNSDQPSNKGKRNFIYLQRDIGNGSTTEYFNEDQNIGTPVGSPIDASWLLQGATNNQLVITMNNPVANDGFLQVGWSVWKDPFGNFAALPPAF